MKLSILGANVFVPDGLKPSDANTGVALTAKIWNVGEPSVVIDWEFAVHAKNKQPVTGQLKQIPPQLKLNGSTNAILHAHDDLGLKTAFDPVSQIPKQGVLLFLVPLAQNIVLAPTTKWILTAKDIYGNEFTTEKLIQDWK